MKKLRIFLLLLLLFPFAISADHSVPTVEYDARIKVTEATLVEVDDWGEDGESIKVPYGTTFPVNYEEYDFKDKMFKAQVTYSGKIYRVNLSDIEVLTKEVDLSKYEECSQKYYVAKKGIYLYNGPALIYGKIEPNVELALDDVVTCKLDDSFYNKGEANWIYVTYNNISGWTNEVVSYNPFEATTLRKADMYDGEKLLLTVPKGTKVKYLGGNRIEYNGTKGEVDLEYLFFTDEFDEESGEPRDFDVKIYEVDAFYEFIKNCPSEELTPITEAKKGTAKVELYSDPFDYRNAYYARIGDSFGAYVEVENGEEFDLHDYCTKEAQTQETTEPEPTPVVEDQKPHMVFDKKKFGYFVIGAGLITIITGIIIIAVNRKKNDDEIIIEEQNTDSMNAPQVPNENNQPQINGEVSPNNGDLPRDEKNQ